MNFYKSGTIISFLVCLGAIAHFEFAVVPEMQRAKEEEELKKYLFSYKTSAGKRLQLLKTSSGYTLNYPAGIAHLTRHKKQKDKYIFKKKWLQLYILKLKNYPGKGAKTIKISKDDKPLYKIEKRGQKKFYIIQEKPRKTLYSIILIPESKKANVYKGKSKKGFLGEVRENPTGISLAFASKKKKIKIHGALNAKIGSAFHTFMDDYLLQVVVAIVLDML
ncbi:hypothetical protein ACFL35_04050 [Candidatus Riflebacteria bacterium]